MFEPSDPEEFRHRVLRRAQVLRRARTLVAVGSVTTIVLSATAAVAFTGMARSDRPVVEATRPTTTESASPATVAPTTTVAGTRPTPSPSAPRTTTPGGRASSHPRPAANPSPRGGRSRGGGSSPAPRTTTPTAPAPVATTTPTTDPATLVRAACAQPPPPDAGVAATARLVGTWVLCSPASLFGTAGGDAGIQIDANHSWALLGFTPSGGLAALNGVGDAGTWSETPVAASSGLVQVVFATPTATSVAGTGQTWVTAVSFLPGNPAWLEMHETGLSAAYVQSPAPVRGGGILRRRPRH